MMFVENMRKQRFMIICILFSITICGCSKTRLGKIDLSTESPPVFLKVGETTLNDVVFQIGEPFGYREQGRRSAMIYVNHHEDYYFLLITELRINKAYRLDLVFQNEVLEKVEIKREGWGLGANLDPQLLQLLLR